MSLAGEVRDQGPGPARLGVGESELVGEPAALTAQQRAGGCHQQPALGLGHALAAQQEHPAGAVLPRRPGAALEQALELLVHLVEVAGRVLVQDHDLGVKALEPPVFLRAQHLAHQRQVVLLDHPRGCDAANFVQILLIDGQHTAGGAAFNRVILQRGALAVTQFGHNQQLGAWFDDFH